MYFYALLLVFIHLPSETADYHGSIQSSVIHMGFFVSITEEHSYSLA